ncbi:MAG: hypothetical protein RR420_00965 [Anaerovoracaceae bacterium]
MAKVIENDERIVMLNKYLKRFVKDLDEIGFKVGVICKSNNSPQLSITDSCFMIDKDKTS